jgi:hypothetical protein
LLVVGVGGVVAAVFICVFVGGVFLGVLFV